MKLDEELKNRITKELSLYHSDNSKTFLLNEIGTSKLERELKDFLSTREEGILTRKGESFRQDKLEWLQRLIEKENPNFKIQSSTLSEVEWGTHPYTNYSLWSNRYYPNEKEKSYLFKYQTENIKSINYFLSTAKKSKSRDRILNRINYLKNGIIRYVGNGDKYLKSNELLKLYDSSYISIILESTYNTNRFIGDCILFSEKTPIGFHTNTLPIILGNRFLNDNLKRLGFFTMNDYFGLDDSSDYAESELVNIIRKIDSSSSDDIENLYNNHIGNIKSNSELQMEIFNLNNSLVSYV